MTYCCQLFIFGLILFGLAFGAEAKGRQKNTTHDIRVLIDVSGSMKQNDPENLRVPAAKLLINLLPANTKAGFWLFSENTKSLISAELISDAWKQQALKKIQKIHSRGLLTDIEKSLQVVTNDWEKASESQKRHLILLTDGMVDVSSDFMESADSRERIIDSIIPKLQQQNIQVHTIALSENADKALMKKLALATGGWHETIHSAKQLQRVFLKILNQAVPQDTLPIVGNTFMIDSSIKEFSLLIFKKQGAPVTRIITPEGQKLSKKDTPEGVNWLNETGYDLVTVKKPQPGQWQIEAELDPDNQVMIVTDLKLNLSELPNSISKGEMLEVGAFLTEQEKLISRPDFLSMLEIKLQQTSADGKTRQWQLASKKDKPGHFFQQLGKTLTEGKHQLIVELDGKTFKRQIKRSIEVGNVPIKIQTQVDKKNRHVTLQLIPDKKILDASVLNVKAFITGPPKEERTVDVQEENGLWKLTLGAPKQGKRLIVNFSVMAKTSDGHSITPDIKPVFIDSAMFAVTDKKEKILEKKEPDENKPKIAEPTEEQEQVLEEELEPEDQDSSDWLMSGLIVAAGNIILLVLGFFIFRWHKKSKLKKQEQLLERLE